MTRCDEFYQKWRQDPNWCDKCRTEVYRINKYIETLDAFPTLKEVSAGALRPILDKKMDTETRNKLLGEVERKVKSEGNVTSTDVQILMSQSPFVNKEAQNKPLSVEKQIIHAATWKETMQPKISRMDEAVFDSLVSKGVGALFQESIPIVVVTPDILIRKGNKNYAVFLDGAQVHAGREDRDQQWRDLLSQRGYEVISIKYEAYSETNRDKIVQEIMETIGFTTTMPRR